MTDHPDAREAGRQTVGLALWLGATFAAAAIGSMATRSAPDFYAQLDRPAWAPPSSVFGPVWTALYLLMALAAWLVWRERDRADALGPLLLYVAQLVLNALWSWLFFAWRQGALSLVEVLALLALIVATMVAFARVKRLAALLLVLYLFWVSYATALTWALWRGNPGQL